MKYTFRSAVVAALGVLALATPSDAAIVTVTFTGITGDGGFGAPWGFDAFGKNIVGDSYLARFTFDLSKGVITSSGGENSIDEPGFAKGSFTVGGHTYDVTGSVHAIYTRTPTSVEVIFYDDPKANSGVVIDAPTDHTAIIGDNLAALIPTLTLAPADVAGSEEDVVLPLDGGALFATLNVKTLAVSTPEPLTGGLMLGGLVTVVALTRRTRTNALRSAGTA